jgi:hypothetical protein
MIRALQTAVPVLWAAYLLVLPFQRVWTLPWLGGKLQPPEIVFIGLAAVSAALWWKGAVRVRFVPGDAAAAAWLGAHVLALVWSPDPQGRDAVVETVGVAYLAVLYAALRVTATPHLLDRFGAWFAYAAAIAAAFGLAGSALSFAGVPTRLATVAVTPVPYLGQAARAQAFTTGPQMLASILILAVPLFLASRSGRPSRVADRAIVALLVLGLAATVSKTALCLVAGLSVMWAAGQSPSADGMNRFGRSRIWIAVSVSLVIAVIFAFGSRVLVVRETAVPTMTASQLVGGEALASFQWRDEAWVVMPSTYLLNNRASLLAIAHAWPAGVGPAGQPAFTARLQHEGRFPGSTWITTPHSTYLGSAAELGLAGLAALGVFVLAGVITISRLFRGPASLRWEAAAFAGAGVAFLIEATSTDLMNCRHYWMLLAVMGARLASLREEPRGGRPA